MEETINWTNLTDTQQHMVLLTHGNGLKKDRSLLRRVFDMGNPDIVIRKEAGTITYCRIAADSVDTMKLFIKTYT